MSKSYKRQWIAHIKLVPGRRWVPQQNWWTIPCEYNVIRVFVQRFQNEPVSVDPILITQFPTLLEHFRRRVQVGLDELIEKMKGTMKLQGFSRRTQKAYVNHGSRFLKIVDILSSVVEHHHMEQYLVNLLDKNCSHPYVNQALSAIKYLLKDVCGRHDLSYHLPRPKKENKLPDVLQSQEVLKILEALSNLKHRAILYLAYSSGLRVSEIVRLHIKDARMIQSPLDRLMHKPPPPTK